MKEFIELLDVAEKLHDPDSGCPWDLVQTFESLREYVLEEAHEVLEAVDSGLDVDIVEELGDLLYCIIFYAKVAEKQKRFHLSDILNTVKEKLIRRHPHIFGEIGPKDVDEVIQNWEKIKKEEKQERKSALDGIPKTLPSLHRASKGIKKMKKKGFNPTLDTEDKYARDLYDLVARSVEEGIDIESVFRTLVSQSEEEFRKWESLDHKS